MKKENLYPAEAAALLKCSTRTLQRDRIQRHLGIPFVKQSPGRAGRVIYRLSDIEAWLISKAKDSLNKKGIAE